MTAGQAVAALLQDPARLFLHLEHHAPGPILRVHLLVAVIGAAAYGLVIGTFSGGDQIWRALVKTTIGLPLAALICLPSLYVFSGLAGARLRPVQVAAMAASLLAMMTLLLLGFAPVAWVFSVSTNGVPFMGTLHLVLWVAAAGFGFRLLGAGLTHFGGRSGAAPTAWALLFLLVSLQMTTAMRPLIGTADTWLPTEKRFFIGHWLSELRTTAE